MKRFLLALSLTLAAFAARATVPSTASTVSYACTGSTTDFAVPFRFLDAAHLVVTKRTTTGLVTTLASGTDYTVAGTGTAAGGTVALVTASRCEATATLTIDRTVPLTQLTSLRAQRDFSPATHENAFDLRAMADQQLERTHSLDKAAQSARDAGQDSTHAADRAAQASRDIGQDTAIANAGTGVATGDSMFIADGASAGRPLKDRASDAWTPRDFSCVGDGVADDRDCLQAWLNAGSLWKRPLVGDGRTYRIGGAASLTVGSDTTIDGRGMVLKPDATMNVPVLYAWGSAGARLSSVSIRGIRMDGTNRPADSSGGFGSFWFGFLDNLTVRDCSFFQMQDAIYLRAVEKFTISGIRANDARSAMVALLSESRHGTVSDLQGINVAEAMDFYNNEDVTVSNVSATGQIDPAHYNEAFDLSTSRRISISNAVVTGFARGVLIKSEAGGTPGAPAWEDLVLSDITVKDQGFEGINAQAAAIGYGATKRLRVRNVTIQSSVAGSSGIKLTPAPAGGLDATFDNLNIDTPGTGFWTYDFAGVKLRGSKIRTSGANAALIGQATHTAGFEVSGCDLGASGGTTADSAVLIQNMDDARVERNAIFSTTGTGLKLSNSIRPVVSGNAISSAGVYGVSLTWSAASGLDARRLATVTGNVIRDWGQASASRAAILLSVSGVTAALDGLDVSGNVAVLSDSATVQAQSPLSLSLGTATLARSRYTNNTAGARVPNDAFDLSLLNADGVWGNVPAMTASVLQGVGSPEGLVVAKIGSLYLQRNGGVQALWLKTLNDSLATGWKVVGSQAAAHTDPADSPAALTDAVTKANFNALLAKLRTAGVLAP